MEIKPQKRQEQFLSSPADIAIYGGAAGGGKTYALLMEAIRHVRNPEFGAVIFRRTHPQIMSKGGLWDTAEPIFRGIGGVPSGKTFKFKSGSTVSFHHLQLEKNRYDWQGSQIPLILWDELTHFTWTQFTYLLSRNRSTCGVAPYIRGTCNPDPDHWLRRFLDWWIDEDGYPVMERSGELRWMAVVNDEAHWADTKEELVNTFGADIEPLSVTFIPSTLEDNPAMTDKDPGYRAKLKALPQHERLALLGGNWNARPAQGAYFQRHWVEFVDAAPAGTRWIRFWDRAATEPSPENPDPDWTVGALVGRTPDGRTIIGDVVRFRGRPYKVRRSIHNTALMDGEDVVVGLEEEPGSSGKADTGDIATKLNGFKVTIRRKRSDKETDWQPLSSQMEAGNVMVIKGDWNTTLFNELEAVPISGHDDQADAVSGGYNVLNEKRRKPMIG